MSVILGTSHFVSEKAAQRYYKPYGYEAEDVREMIANGSINIGEPDFLKPGEVLVKLDNGTRYGILTEKL